MLRTPANANTKDDVDALLSEQTPEGRALDYKRELKLNTDDDKREFTRDVASFANASGGFIVFGVDEAKSGGQKLGYPGEISGVEYPSFDALQQKIDAVLRERLDPRVQGVTIAEVGPYSRGNVVIVHVPKSWNAPHMVSFGQTHFFSRNNSGRHPLDALELRAAFLAGSDVGERVKRFRDDRVGKIIADETPVLVEHGAKLIVHVVPVADPSADDIAWFHGKLLPIVNVSGFNSRYNLDGLVVYDGSHQTGSWSYTMAFRNSALEGVTRVMINGGKSPPTIYGTRIEFQVVKACEHFVRLSRRRGYRGPLSILVSLVGVLGARIVVSDDQDWMPFEKHAIDRGILVLPDVLIEDEHVELVRELKPIFDSLWQASGYERSQGYTDSGEWLTELHARHG